MGLMVHQLVGTGWELVGMQDAGGDLAPREADVLAVVLGPSEPSWSITAPLHSPRGTGEPRRLWAGLRASSITSPQRQSNGTFPADGIRRTRSCQPLHHQSTNSCLMFLRSQRLSGPEEQCVGPQQTWAAASRAWSHHPGRGRKSPCLSR